MTDEISVFVVLMGISIVAIVVDAVIDVIEVD